MEENKKKIVSTDIKERFFNLVMDHGVALALCVAFLLALYYILHEHNTKLMAYADRLFQELIECYKTKN